MAQPSSGTASTSAPTPRVQMPSKIAQPTGTAQIKGSVRRKPWLAASAVESVVFGPGVKLIAVAKVNKAVNSCQFMATNFIVETSTPALQ